MSCRLQRLVQWLGIFWVSVFLWSNAVHPMMHDPSHGEGDCLVCVVHKTPTLADTPIRQAVAVSSLFCVDTPLLHLLSQSYSLSSFTLQPLIPRAPPV